MAFSLNGAETLSIYYRKPENWPLLPTIHKVNSVWVEGLNVRGKTIMLPEGSKGKYLYDLWVQVS